MNLPAITAPVMRVLDTADPGRATAFYRDVLGFDIREVDGGVEAHRGPARLRFGSGGRDGMVFLETADLDAMRAAVLARGGAPSGIDKINWVKFRVFNLRRDPANVVTWDNRDRIIVQDLEGLCAPGLSH